VNLDSVSTFDLLELVAVLRTKAARTITISSGGKRRDDTLNPIVQRVKKQLIALVSLHSNREKIAQACTWVLKVSGASFADAARGILTAGYAAAYVAGKKDTTAAPVPVVAPPTAIPSEADQGDTSEAAQERRDEQIQQSIEDPLDDMDEEDAAFYGDSLDDLDSDGQQAVGSASDGLNDRLLALGALLIGGAVSAAMLDAWMGTYADSLNPLYEEGFVDGVQQLGTVIQAEWVSENDANTCDGCQALDGMTWTGDDLNDMPLPGNTWFGGERACGPRCRCSCDYSYIPASDAETTGPSAENEGDIGAMSTADLLKVWSILAKAE